MQQQQQQRSRRRTSRNISEQLWETLVKEGSIAFRAKLLSAMNEEDHDVNDCSLPPRQRTLLAKACIIGNAEGARILLECDADPNVTDSRGSTCLHEACLGNYFEIAQLLLERGADASIQDSSGSTALHYAMGYYLETATRRYHLVDSSGAPRLPLVRLLLQDYGANPNVHNTWDRDTPLHCAAILGNVSVGRLLLEEGANPNSLSRYGPTPLHRAMAGSRRVAFMRVLLEHGADANQLDHAGNTLLHSAVFASYQYVDVVELLLQFGANATLEDQHGNVVLVGACEHGRTSYIFLLLRHMIGNGTIQLETQNKHPNHASAVRALKYQKLSNNADGL